ncbi:hypothetical protein ACJA25_03195 [Mycoplasmopsis hyopharyngis]|uniref:hypothetical protein n=1 Tax=Mycoplasmopsis hyopharyngis TaxID=29558 RepID=UPI003872B440
MLKILFDKHIKKLNRKYDFQKKDERKEINKIILDYSISLDINPIYENSFMPIPPYYLDDQNDPRVVAFTLKKELFPNIDLDVEPSLATMNFPSLSEMKEKFNTAYSKTITEFVGFESISDEAAVGDYVKLFNPDKQKTYIGILEENPRKQIFNISLYQGKAVGDVIELKLATKEYNLEIVGFARKSNDKKLEIEDLKWYFPFEKFSKIEDFYKKLKLKLLSNVLFKSVFMHFLNHQVEFILLNNLFENFGDLVTMYEIQTGSKNAKSEIIFKLFLWIISFNCHKLDLNLHQESILKEMSNIYYENDERYDEEKSFNSFNEILYLVKISSPVAYENTLALLNEFSI